MMPLLLPWVLVLAGAEPPPTGGVVVEAEAMKLGGAWKSVLVGEGNLVADQAGLGHVSGGRVALLPSDMAGKATATVTISRPGTHVLWVRREHAPGCDAPFVVSVEQDNKVAKFVAGRKLNPVFGPGDTSAQVRQETPQGTDPLVEERFVIPGLAAGKAVIALEGEAFEGIPGATSARSVDALVLTDDTADAWRARLSRKAPQYPILELVRELAGPRWEARFRHAGDSLASFSASHQYNRAPLGAVEGPLARDLEPGKWSAWTPLPGQDTCRAGMCLFTGPEYGFEVEVRPTGSTDGETVFGFGGKRSARVYLPPYPGRGEKPETPEQALARIFQVLDSAPAPGRVPEARLCLGENVPSWAGGGYGERYAELHVRLFGGPGAGKDREAAVAGLRRAGRNHQPGQVICSGADAALETNISKVCQDLKRQGLADATVWYELAEDPAPAAWLAPLLEEEAARDRAAGKGGTPAKALNRLWVDWLEANRGKVSNGEYWLGSWGSFDRLRMRPCSSAEAAVGAPRLYVDSLLFYEEAALRRARAAAARVRLALGRDTRVGITTPLDPFYVPTVAGMALARGGAADFVRPGDGFWRCGQAGPLANGYAAEFASMALGGRKDAVVRPFNLAQAPGNTDDDFVRSAITQLAHGARRLDFGGVGLDETMAGNHVDHRAATRFRAIRDVAHAVGMVEDILPASRPVASPVALLVSESTERWDLAGIMADGGVRSWTGPGFSRARLTHHLERLGLYAALVHQGRSPDLVNEADCTPEKLKGVKLLVVVGDCLPADLATRLGAWVREGGVLLATAGAGRFDPYRKPQAAFDKLLGQKARLTTEKDTFALPRRGLGALPPLDAIAGPGWLMPVVGCLERMDPEESTQVVARFQGDDSPAVCYREMGKGRVLTVAAFPGMACLWTAAQPVQTPDRGPSGHKLPTAYDAGAMALVAEALKAAGVEAEVRVENRLADGRVLESEKGFIVPVAQYGKPVEERVEILVRLPRGVSRATSAFAGPVPVRKAGDFHLITLPGLGAGDILRLE